MFPQVNSNNRINARDIYNFVEVKTDFYSWIRRCIEYADLKDGEDFIAKLQVSTGGRPAKSYEFTVDATKEMCIVSATPKAKELRRWLIDISNKVETGKLLSGSQVVEIIRMIKIFSIYEYRKLARVKNSDNYIHNALMSNPQRKNNIKTIYVEFNTWRNEVLKTGKEDLTERIKEYCLLERKRIPAKFTQDEALTMMGEYEQIKNAIWDLLSSQNKSNELINNICEFASVLAKEMQPFLERLNQSNLFFTKIETSEIKRIGL